MNLISKERLAGLVLELNELIEAKRSAVKDYNEAITALRQEINTLAQQIKDGQQDLPME